MKISLHCPFVCFSFNMCSPAANFIFTHHWKLKWHPVGFIECSAILRPCGPLLVVLLVQECAIRQHKSLKAWRHSGEVPGQVGTVGEAHLLFISTAENDTLRQHLRRNSCRAVTALLFLLSCQTLCSYCLFVLFFYSQINSWFTTWFIWVLFCPICLI